MGDERPDEALHAESDRLTVLRHWILPGFPLYDCLREVRPRLRRPSILMGGVFCLGVIPWSQNAVSAAELYSSGNTALRWDNTVSYSAIFRLTGRDPVLLDQRNEDDGDRNFAPGLAGNRFDLLSQLDFSSNGFGFHISGAAWYDTVYHQGNDNNSPSTFNPASVSNTSFTRDVRNLHGGRAELLDAFLYLNADLAGRPFSFRLGRHTLLWGESLFFPDNGIAAGQAPVDVIKVLGRPNAYTRDAFLPVTQASASVQLSEGLSLEAYYQFEWRKTRLPGVGSFLSSEDYYDAGGERYILRSGHVLLRGNDLTPPDSGQFGGALRWSLDQVDYGLYALRFNAKDPVVYYRSGIDQGPPPTIVDPSLVDLSTGKAGFYNLVFPRGIEIYGASASGYIGNSNVAGEISVRRNMPLANSRIFPTPGQFADADKYPAYPKGETLHAQISTITTLSPSFLWDSMTINAEIAAVDRLSVRRNEAELDPDSNKLSIAFRGSVEPTYFEVAPNLDVTFRLGFSYVAGRPSIHTYQIPGAGSLDIGLTATYRVAWSGSVTFTRFLGRPERQPLSDRDFVRFTLQRSF